MSDFKTLSQTFQALVRRSTADVQGGNAHSGGDKDTGFAEAQTQFEGVGIEPGNRHCRKKVPGLQSRKTMTNCY
jgi:hypothetical protein